MLAKLNNEEMIMDNTKEITKKASQVRTVISVAMPTVGERLSLSVLVLTLGSASLVSLWSFAGLIGAVISSGPVGVVSGLITALTGI